MHSINRRKLCFCSALALAGAVVALAADWPSQSGGPQREGWAKSERILSKADIRDLKLLYAFEPKEHSSLFLSAPIVNGNLITYRGFKEMLVFSANSNRVFSVDADLDKLIWESHFEAASANTPCSGGMSSPVVMSGSSSATIHFAPPAPRLPGAPPRHRRSPYFPPLSQTLSPLLPTTLTQLNAMYTVSGDGALHILNSSTGEDLLPPTPFLPAGEVVGSLNLRDNVVYATTAGSCGGKQNALYAIDLLSSDKHVSSFVAPHGGFAGLAGTAIGSDGTIFVQLDSSPDDKPGHTHETLVALAPKDLKVKNYFTPQIKEIGKKSSPPGITPLVFRWHGKAVVIAGFSDGRLYLLDGNALGGADHKTALFRSEPVAAQGKNKPGGAFQGTFASWPDIDADKRWFYAPVVGSADTGIEAFRMSEANGQLALEQIWASHGMISPDPPVIANGLIFALSTGNPPLLSKKKGKKTPAKPAVLYAFDAVTGQQLYSSAATIAVPAQPNGLAVANARVYFSGKDGRVYCFGLPKTQPQLAEQHTSD
jgi:outer membrane protein assembly factor BamB